MFNGLSHHWEFPEFSITYEGHELRDASKAVLQTFTVQGQYTWPKGHVCTLSQSLDFGLFVIEKYSFRLIGGIKTPTAEDKAAELRRAEATAAEEDSKREVDIKRKQRIAAARKRKQADADARYAEIKAEEESRLPNNKRREEQQVRACQALGLYLPE